MNENLPKYSGPYLTQDSACSSQDRKCSQMVSLFCFKEFAASRLGSFFYQLNKLQFNLITAG